MMVSKENPQSCMDYLILPARTTEAHCHFLVAKCVSSHGSEGARQKTGRLAAAPEGRMEWSGALQAPLPPLQPIVVWPPLSSFPPLASGLGKEEDEEEDVDIETIFSSDDKGVITRHVMGCRRSRMSRPQTAPSPEVLTWGQGDLRLQLEAELCTAGLWGSPSQIFLPLCL